MLSNMDPTTMIRTPYASDALVDTLHRLGDPLLLLTTCVPQKLGFL
jgi:hypothetical protein